MTKVARLFEEEKIEYANEKLNIRMIEAAKTLFRAGYSSLPYPALFFEIWNSAAKCIIDAAEFENALIKKT